MIAPLIGIVELKWVMKESITRHLMVNFDDLILELVNHIPMSMMTPSIWVF